MAVVISQLVVVAQTRFGVGRYIHAMCDFPGQAHMAVQAIGPVPANIE